MRSSLQDLRVNVNALKKKRILWFKHLLRYLRGDTGYMRMSYMSMDSNGKKDVTYRYKLGNYHIYIVALKP